MRVVALIAIILICASAASAYHCTPGLVQNINLDSSYYLTWNTTLNPNNCTITSYVIKVIDPEDGTELQFQTTDNYTLYYDLYFLDMCKTYIFEVHALTNEFVLGPANRLSLTTQPQSSMDLSLVLRLKNSTSENMEVSWNMWNSSVTNCVSYYRVIYWDENNRPTDLYVNGTNFTLPKLVPCMSYRVQVNAVVNNPDLVGPIDEVNVTGLPTVPSQPKLAFLTATSTEVTMAWKVPLYSENRCRLTSLVLYTIGVPANQTIVAVPIEDSPLRPNVQVTLDRLSPNHVYQSFVALYNDKGPSKNVSVSYQTSDSFNFNYLLDLDY